MSIPKETMKELFQFLLKSRLVEEKLLDINSRGEIPPPGVIWRVAGLGEYIRAGDLGPSRPPGTGVLD